MKNRFNLIDEPWIPIAGVGLVSLGRIFRHPEYSRLGGNPVQKIVLMKLLLAVAQAAATPSDEKEWLSLGVQGLAKECRNYLAKWHDRFYLYGKRPFLQMPEISTAAKQSYGALLPEISTGNTTVHMQSQIEKQLNDAEKALLITTQMGFALGGKKVDNSVTLTKSYNGKSKAGKPGPAIAHMGLLHNFIFSKSILGSLWLNLFSHESINSYGIFSKGVGTAPWELMPDGEDCPRANELKNSLIGRLIPLCRFCLLNQNTIHYSEGIAHLNYLDGFFDPTIAVDCSGRKNKVIWADPEKRPWRQLPALLSFIKQANNSFNCLQLRLSLPRACKNLAGFYIWSGGLRVSSNAGEQYVSGNDDFVESEAWINSEFVNETWFNQLEIEINNLDTIGKKLYGSIASYYKTQLTDGTEFAKKGVNTYWQLCEQDFQNLIDTCDESPEATQQRKSLRHRFAGYVRKVYDQSCPNDTARQMDAWAKCRPNLSSYLQKEES